MTSAAPATARPAIVFENVRLGFEEGDVLKDVSFTVAPRQTAVLLGETGTGKTLILKLAAGIIRPDARRVACQPSRRDRATVQTSVPNRGNHTVRGRDWCPSAAVAAALAGREWLQVGPQVRAGVAA